MNSASLCCLAGRYENPIPPRCLAPIDFLKIPALLPFLLHGSISRPLLQKILVSPYREERLIEIEGKGCSQCQGQQKLYYSFLILFQNGSYSRELLVCEIKNRIETRYTVLFPQEICMYYGKKIRQM